MRNAGCVAVVTAVPLKHPRLHIAAATHVAARVCVCARAHTSSPPTSAVRSVRVRDRATQRYLRVVQRPICTDMNEQ